MTRQPIPLRIPLLGISETVKRQGRAEDWPQGLKHLSEVEISLSQSLPGQCFAMELPDILNETQGSGKSLGVFGFNQGVAGLNDIFAVGLVGREPYICKVIKNDAQVNTSQKQESTTSSSPIKNPRKSFMTPTPLHIPESRVSPIPDSAHEMVYLKGLNEKEALKVVPLRHVVWMHPLILVTEKPQG